MTRTRQRGVGRPPLLACLLVVLFLTLPLRGETGTSTSFETTASEPEKAATWLSWQPPPECPRADFVLERVRSWLGGALPESTDLQAAGEVRWTGEDWEVSVVLLMDGARGERHVRVATCGDAAEFLAVAIVLAVDPSRVSELPALDEMPAPEGDERPAPPPDEATEVAEAAPPPPVETKEEPRRRSKQPWFLGVGVEGALGALPSFQLGPLIEGGIERGPLVIGLGARLLPPVSQSPAGAVADISYALAAGRLEACYLADLGLLDLGPCANLDVGAIWTHQGAPGDTSQVVPWVELQLGPKARLFGPKASLVLGARLSVPLTQPTFVVSTGAPVHQPTVGMVADIGAEFFFGRE